ncbi:MAG: hypothetical protein BV457_05420 [Thermoplasmata archaeon M9B1D]|nr:MAG: hypothetical protein BV457_05420 [Thermoplasmata archaeon M9B1D]PNX50255.1 MAG: hypothetical protein BV456_07270 [Thermoplasmata archaeon M8B2D]
MEKKVNLNVGCGRDYKQNFINMDFDESVKADVYHNLNVYPYPFDNDTFDFILVSHVLEHLLDQYGFMMEMRRILKKDGEIVIKLPIGVFNYAHQRGIHVKDYFKGLTNKSDKNGQTGNYFSLVYQKRHIRHYIRMYYRFRNWFLNLFADEWEYKLKKVE